MKSGSDLSLMLYQLYQLQWDPVQDQDRECAVQWDPLQEDRECCCQVVQQQTQTIAENMKFKKFKLAYSSHDEITVFSRFTVKFAGKSRSRSRHDVKIMVEITIRSRCQN